METETRFFCLVPEVMLWQALPERPTGERAGQDHSKDNNTDDRRIQHFALPIQVFR
jgi:hypothetical protein